MDADFPAAHRMGTSWFAIDQVGHVGYPPKKKKRPPRRKKTDGGD